MMSALASLAPQAAASFPSSILTKLIVSPLPLPSYGIDRALVGADAAALAVTVVKDDPLVLGEQNRALGAVGLAVSAADALFLVHLRAEGSDNLAHYLTSMTL